MKKCYDHEECEYNAQPDCALPDGAKCPHGVPRANADGIRLATRERLTERAEDGKYFVRESRARDLTIRRAERISPGQEKWTCWWEYAVLGTIVDRLAAYENTGLAPEEIPKILAKEEPDD